MNRFKYVAMGLLLAIAPAMSFVGNGPAVTGRVTGFRINGVRGTQPQLWFKLAGDNNYYILRVDRTTQTGGALSDVIRAEIRNSERAILMQAYTSGETIMFQRSSSSVSTVEPNVFDIDNLTLGPVQ